MSGAATAANHTNSPTLTDLDQAFLVYGIRIDTGSPVQGQIGGVIESTTVVGFDRFESGAAGVIIGYVTEFTDGVRVERGTISNSTFDGAADQLVTIELENIGDIDKAFVFHNIEASGAGSNYDTDDAFTSWLSVSNGIVSINAQCSDADTVSHNLNWEVIQYTNCAVQRGSEVLGTGATSVSAVLSPAVDVDKSFVQCSKRHGTGTVADIGGKKIRGRHTINAVSGDEVTFDRDHTDSLAIDDIRWEVVEFTDDVVVEEVLETFVDTDVVESFTISEVSSLTEAIAFASTVMMQGRSALSTDDISGASLFTPDLTTTTNLESRRTAGDDESLVAFYVVDFGAAPAGATEDEDAGILIAGQQQPVIEVGGMVPY